MTDALYLRLKSLNTRTVRGVTSPKNIVRVAAMHNLREIQAELGASAASGINPARMHLNYQLRGPATADGVAALALALLDNAGVQTLRRDACMALELVVSLPANTAIDHRAYFAAAVAWADTHFNVPILSAAVHLDEAAPHCHILLMPLVAGRMQGGALAGGPVKIRAMLADFQQQVAQRFGMTHQPRAKRLSKPNRDAAGRVVLDALRARPERLSEPAMRDALVAALGSKAEALLALLGLSMPTTKPKAKSFADIMTAPCKPERVRRVAPNTKHIDVAQNLGNGEGDKSHNVYLCVDVAHSPFPNPALEQPVRSTCASTTPAKRKLTAVNRQPATAPAPGFPEPVDVDHQHGADDTASQSAESSAHLDVSTFARISSPPTGPTKATYDVELVDHQAGAGEPSYTSRPKLSTNDSTPRANGMRPHKHQSISGCIYRGGGASPPPSGVPSVGQSRAAHGDLLKTQQVDQQAGQADAHRCSPAEGGYPSPRRGMAPTAKEYRRHRDEDHLATSWNEQCGEFAPTTGPPPRAGRHQARKTL